MRLGAAELAARLMSHGSPDSHGPDVPGAAYRRPVRKIAVNVPARCQPPTAAATPVVTLMR